jgi:hypothetical protein
MSDINHDLEELWGKLLSRDAERVRSAYYSLSTVEQEVVFSHLKRMATEPDWQPEQRISASAALEAIHPDSEQV